MPRLLSLHIGKIQTFGPADQPSAIAKPDFDTY